MDEGLPPFVVTICFVGSGDISPQSGVGKVFCLFAIVVSLPQQTNEHLLNLREQELHLQCVPIGQAKHVILCGGESCEQLSFVEEFFGELLCLPPEIMRM
jgi:hypothetical protein